MFAFPELRAFFAELTRHSDVFSFAGAVDAGRIGEPRTAIMRHDVDIDIDAAVQLAEIEAEHGIRATYLVLTGCETYNVASATNRRQLRRLVEMGFEIGLHFDPLLYPDLEDDALAPALAKEAEWLADITAEPVRTISLHNPSQHGRYPRFEGFINAYDKAFFDPDFYLSDSCMGFRGKDPMTFARKAEEHFVQILLHPFHYSETGGGYPDCYAAYLRRLTERIDEAMQVNATYVEQMSGRSLFGNGQ